MSVKTFEDLQVWQVCRVVRQRMSSLAKCLPRNERYRLADQIVRASRSATANLAEGFGRFHYQDNVRFCRLAKGSLCEVLDHLTVANDEGYISNEEYSALRQQTSQAVTVLNGYIRYLNKAKSGELTNTNHAPPNNEQRTTNNRMSTQ